MSTPLETRSLPGHLWERAPESIKALDESLRQNILLNENSHFSQALRWLVESPTAISLFLLFLLVLLFKNKDQRKQPLKTKVLASISLLLLLGVSDYSSNLIKLIVGRLKPHVDYYNYNPEFLPALSLPSSHAFNSTCLLVFLIFTLGYKKQLAFLNSLALITLLIGWSRIALGQHYPLDVLAGWLMGALFGYCGAMLWKKITVRVLTEKT